jgi:Ni/Fe-hydrogenase subunit HybB-like protein
MWNDHSVLFEVAWCVMLYSTVLALEFSPVVFEQYKMHRALKVVRKISLPLIILGVLLSTLHQSSLGSLFLIVPEKMYALWYTPYLPVLFYVSAISVGCAMIIIESLLSTRLTKKGLEMSLMTDLARAAVVMIAVSFTMRVVDLLDRGAFNLLFIPRTETYYYWAEIITGIVAPFILLVNPRVRRSRTGLMIGSSLIMIGFVLNRLDVCITSLQASWAPATYFPSWMEFSISLSIVVAGFVIFATIAKYFPVFTNPEVEEHKPNVSEWDLDLALVSSAPVPEIQNGIHS